MQETGQAMGVADVQAALDKLCLEITIIEFDSSTATSQQAADNIGCQLGQIVKSLGFLVNKSQPVLVLASGDQHIDERKLARRFGVGRKKVRMMNARQCLELLGYAPGGVPPIAHRSSGLPILMDASLRRFDTIYAAGGAAHAIFPMSTEKLREITAADYADLTRDT
ncbi:MAG: YbaK/EbsC family protein [Chloroflexi bacterium]|nr:YbaK/EbsC family protein [Chloroflexota bacterium]MCY3584044.1 YbaK/EbsC family protein [Chloroflexota bacterium]MCY3717188.1 YbaK/EbsC family protein [Chloroflexota bacterium]MDE2651794.1 YbaK/EbsC family protein [Chloroflexota bacterium]MXV92835.1 YbaK/EbsC family protein [Chloroflexota bacterium]